MSPCDDRKPDESITGFERIFDAVTRFVLYLILHTVGEIILIVAILALFAGWASKNSYIRGSTFALLAIIGLVASAACIGYIIAELRHQNLMHRLIAFLLGCLGLATALSATVILIMGFLGNGS